VNVYYDDLSYYLIDESPAMTFDLFLGSVGGNLGLFLGECIQNLIFFLSCQSINC
jgi:hypothetical protein